jgi:hypothetical protein
MRIQTTAATKLRLLDLAERALERVARRSCTDAEYQYLMPMIESDMEGRRQQIRRQAPQGRKPRR